MSRQGEIVTDNPAVSAEHKKNRRTLSISTFNRFFQKAKKDLVAILA